MLHHGGELWCNGRMRGTARKSHEKPQIELVEDASVRASISFPSELYRTLEQIAREKKVSLAWVVRDAAEQYVSDKWPLFKGKV